jgi:hypothetical protein
MRYIGAFNISMQDVIFLQEKLINLRAIHIEYHTKIDELFAVIIDDKIDEQTAKVIDLTHLIRSLFESETLHCQCGGSGATTHRPEFNCQSYRCLDFMVILVNEFTSATNLRR